MQRSIVVLPQPEGPTIATHSRRPISRSTFWNTRSDPNSFASPSIRIRLPLLSAVACVAVAAAAVTTAPPRTRAPARRPSGDGRS